MPPRTSGGKGARTFYLVRADHSPRFLPLQDSTMRTAASLRNEETRVVIDAQIDNLRQQIQNMQERIAVLGAERNSVVPIASLPPELLIRIFGLVAQTNFSFVRVPALIDLMLVCRHWKDLASAAHTLWNDITIAGKNSERYFKEHLRFTGTAPLTIKIFEFDAPYFIPCLFDNAARLKSLALSTITDTKYLFQFMRRMPSYEFPVLESLALNINLDPSSFPQVVPRNACLPGKLLDGHHLPRLAELSLWCVGVPLESLPPLRSLDLRGSQAVAGTRHSIHAILTYLQSCPELHTLRLSRAIAGRGVDDLPTVSLPKLELLHIQSLVYDFEDLLTHLTFPPTARLELFTDGIETGTDIRNMLVPIRRHARAPAAPVALAISLRVPPATEESQHFCIATYPDAEPIISLDQKPLLLLNSHPSNARDLRLVMTKVLKALPTDSITHLDAHGANLPRVSWRLALALLPSLEEVGLRVEDAGTQFLSGALSSAGNPVSRVVIYSLVDEGDYEETTTPFLSALMRLVHTYDHDGTQLDRLDIRDRSDGMRLTDTQIAALRRRVGEFILNGDSTEEDM
ncbi:F-box domain-containing protein [Favolaschia claudopus]|uniref:F-box domain-containing protein n=1 Tax=Favolaschia claudopus TaxID=2862362 RepID=A0AAW0ACW5_9AGAR